MIESLEFWGLIVTLLVGFVSTFVMLHDIRNRVCENAERIVKLETETHLEFDKCRLHNGCNLKGVNDYE